jgi:hypothetical protein
MTHQLCREDGVQSTALKQNPNHGESPATPTLQPLAYILLTFATQKMSLPMHPRIT